MQAAGGFLGRQVPCGQIGVGDRIEPQRQIARRLHRRRSDRSRPGRSGIRRCKGQPGDDAQSWPEGKLWAGHGQRRDAAAGPADDPVGRAGAGGPEGGQPAIGGDRGTDIHDYPAKAAVARPRRPGVGRTVPCCTPKRPGWPAGALAGRMNGSDRSLARGIEPSLAWAATAKSGRISAAGWRRCTSTMR